MSHNINQFFTAQTSPLFYKIQRILHKFQLTEFDGITSNAYIYGGFVRDMINNYYNPTEKFNFNNVNIWLNCAPYRHGFDSCYEFCDVTFQQLRDDHDIIIENITYSNYDITEQFNLVTLTIEGINFNFCTDINMPNFENLCDFTVNNLFMDIYGNLFKRAKCEYSVNQIILDIKHKKLVKIMNQEYFNQVYDYYKYKNEDEDDGESYEIESLDYNFDEVYPKLETKMKSYGYYNLVGDKVDDKVDDKVVEV
jgi:hypothetical protein